MVNAQPVATAAKLLARMTDAEHQDIVEEFFGLFYGGKGVHKSTTAQYLAQKLRGDGQILFAASGTGFAGVERFPLLKRNTSHLRMPDPRELYQLSKALRVRAKGYEAFTVLVLDDFDSWWQDTLHNYAFEKANLNPAEDELPEIDWTWYGPPQQAMLKTVKNFYNTEGLHVIITTHDQARPLKNEKGGPDRYEPLLGTKLSAGIGHLSHLVGRFESRTIRDLKTKQQKHVTEVQIQPSRYVDAKSRLSNTNEIKLDSIELVKLIADWVLGGGIVEAEVTPEAQVVADETEDKVEDDDFEVVDGEV
jgi:hypothetical protein